MLIMNLWVQPLFVAAGGEGKGFGGEMESSFLTLA
jgi:hypothetical protein